MTKIIEIAKFLDKTLDTKNISDNSNNGIQVETKKIIKKIGFAVDACIETFERAKEENCDLLIVHHGISWNDNLKNITENNYDRISYLIKNDIGLYASHLPLDKHSKYGNNIQIAKKLGLKKIVEFGDYNGISIGFGGEIKETDISNFAKLVEEKLDTLIRIVGFGKNKIKKIAIVSGGGVSTLPQAISNNYDCLITGESNHGSYHQAKEGKINIVIAGHYATEVFGVKALMPALEKKFGIKTVFIDVPTGF